MLHYYLKEPTLHFYHLSTSVVAVVLPKGGFFLLQLLVIENNGHVKDNNRFRCSGIPGKDRN